MQVYLNGAYVDAADARVPVDDRGFLFADGVYEVMMVYPQGIFMGEPHIVRMRNGLAALQIDTTPAGEILGIAEHLLDVNGLRGVEATVYVQVTRGVAPRKHAFPPADTRPTVFVATKPFKRYPAEYWTEGVAAITLPDNRWARCDIKSVALLPNVLANQAAHAADAFEALFVKDGVVIEGSHSNLFAVLDGTLITYPSCNYILSGITRSFLIELARELEIPFTEGALLWQELPRVEELFLSGTTTEVMPINRIDGRTIGDGRPGPITQKLMQEFRKRTL